MNEEVYKDSLPSRLLVHLVGQPTSSKDQHFIFQKNTKLLLCADLCAEHRKCCILIIFQIYGLVTISNVYIREKNLVL